MNFFVEPTARSELYRLYPDTPTQLVTFATAIYSQSRYLFTPSSSSLRHCAHVPRSRVSRVVVAAERCSPSESAEKVYRVNVSDPCDLYLCSDESQSISTPEGEGESLGASKGTCGDHCGVDFLSTFTSCEERLGSTVILFDVAKEAAGGPSTLKAVRECVSAIRSNHEVRSRPPTQIVDKPIYMKPLLPEARAEICHITTLDAPFSTHSDDVEEQRYRSEPIRYLPPFGARYRYRGTTAVVICEAWTAAPC